MTLEFLTASGPSAYVANMALGSGSDTLRFDEVMRIEAGDRIPLDAALFTWRKRWATGSATVTLIPQTIDGSPDGYRICWLTQYAALNRLTCSVHGRDYAIHLVDDYFGQVRSYRSQTGAIPWNPTPPEGTPAPPLGSTPLRYAYGYQVVSMLVTPSLGTWANNSVTVRANDGSNWTGRLSASMSEPLPYRGITTFSSSVNDERTAALTFSTRYGTRGYDGDVTSASLQAEGTTRALPGAFRLSNNVIYPLDITLAEVGDGEASAKLILQSNDGGPVGFRLCWLTRFRSLNRLACGVSDLPGSTGYMVDDHAGVARVYR
jgi:hypothetical protein